MLETLVDVLCEYGLELNVKKTKKSVPQKQPQLKHIWLLNMVWSKFWEQLASTNI